MSTNPATISIKVLPEVLRSEEKKKKEAAAVKSARLMAFEKVRNLAAA